MTSKTLLRISAFLLLIHLVGHIFGHSTWDTPQDPQMMEVVSTMKGYKAEFMGAIKSMADYHHGYSLMIIGLFAMSVTLLWQASAMIKEHTQVSTMVITLGAVYLCFGVIEYFYFFPFAASMSFFAGGLSLIAAVKGRH